MENGTQLPKPPSTGNKEPKNAVTALDAEAAEVSDVLELRGVRGEHDVTQQRKRGVHRRRAVVGRDHRRLDLE